MTTLLTIITIGLGATIGASIRYYLALLALKFNYHISYSTLFANVLGSFIAGVLLVIILEKSLLPEVYRLLLLVGLCGSLTTFSAFSIETVQFLTDNEYLKATLNIVFSVCLSILAFIMGSYLARYFL